SSRNGTYRYITFSSPPSWKLKFGTAYRLDGAPSATSGDAAATAAPPATRDRRLIVLPEALEMFDVMDAFFMVRLLPVSCSNRTRHDRGNHDRAGDPSRTTS